MASRHRTCHHLVPSVHVSMPYPQLLLLLAPVMSTIVEAASEFDACDPEATWTAVEFAQWLDVEVPDAVLETVERMVG